MATTIKKHATLSEVRKAFGMQAYTTWANLRRLFGFPPSASRAAMKEGLSFDQPACFGIYDGGLKVLQVTVDNVPSFALNGLMELWIDGRLATAAPIASLTGGELGFPTSPNWDEAVDHQIKARWRKGPVRSRFSAEFSIVGNPP